MSKLLEEAFARLAKLPEADQGFIARWLLEKLASETRWEELLSDPGEAPGRPAR
jgi:hypothetical protein